MRPLVIAALIAVIAPVAYAEQPSPRDMALHLFAKADADGDGAMTAEEYEAAGYSRFGGTFEALDADVDGAVTEAEYLDAFTRAHAPGEDA